MKLTAQNLIDKFPKKCSKCGAKKHIDDFGLDKRKPDGHKYHCKKCHNKTNKKYRTAHPENHRKTNLAYARSAVGRAKQRANNLRRKFWPHMTNEQAVAEYDRMLAEQKNCCGLCGLNQFMFKMRFAVDHQKHPHKIRGLLCNKCNRFEVGRHTLESLKLMVQYFEKYK